jgi:hypothetical protein
MWVFGKGEPGDSAIVLTGYLSGYHTGPGRASDSPVEVDVAKSGYALWWRDDVELTAGKCGSQWAGPLHVWLLPTIQGEVDMQWIMHAF